MQYLLALTLLLAPTYAIRLNLFGLPTNVLMLWLFALWIVFAIWLFARSHVADFFGWLVLELYTRHTTLVTLFALAGGTSLFVSGFSQEKLGQFIVLFVQPIGTFAVARYCWSRNQKSEIRNQTQDTKTLVKDEGLRIKDTEPLMWVALLFVALAGIYAVIQYFTLLGVPEAWWGNSEEPKRAVAFFLHPNFYALFVTPLLAFLVPQIVNRNQKSVNREQRQDTVVLVKDKGLRIKDSLPAAAWVLGATGMLFSLSRGAWLGLLVAGGVYLLVTATRTQLKRAAVLFSCAVIIVLAVPNFRYRVLLPFRGEKSSVARLSLWNTGWKMVKDNPIMGKGLLGFSNNWYDYNTDSGLDHYPAPHNIFLNFWVDTGLLGLLSFAGLLVLAIWRGIKDKRNVFKLGLALACIAMVFHGLVDIPYFKNDLALVFWMLYIFI